MNRDILNSWKTENKLSSKGEYIYGNYNRVGFSVNEEDGGALLVLTMTADDKQSYKSIQTDLDAKFSDIQVGQVDNYLALMIKSVTSARQLSEIVDAGVDLAMKNGFVAPVVCEYCASPSFKLRFDDGIVRPVCSNCKDKDNRRNNEPSLSGIEENDYSGESFAVGRTKESVSSLFTDDSDDFGSGWGAFTHNALEDDEFSYSNNNYDYGGRSDGNIFTGFLGAAIGAAMGVIPYILLNNFFNLPIAALCILSGILSVLFYVFLRGKRSVKAGLTFSILLSICASAFAVYYVQNGIEMQQTGIPLSQTLLTSINVEFLVQLGMALAGVILGVLVFKRTLNNYSDE